MRAPGYALCALLCLAAVPPAVLAQTYDTPGVGSIDAGHAKWTVEVTAGPTGAPNGFVVWWMKSSDFTNFNETWFPTGNQFQASVYFTGAPTLNTFEGAYTTFLLGPNETIRLEIGDLFDETGFTSNALALEELDENTEYVFCAWAIGDGSVSASAYSENKKHKTKPRDCVHSKGYWKNHPNDWPVQSLTLGTVNYTKQQLLDILHKPAQGNGLLILAHQLIAAKLNIANGADPTDIQDVIDDADAQINGLVIPPIGSGYLHPSTVNKKAQDLDDYNNSKKTSCSPVPVQSSSWGRIKAAYR